VGDFFLKEIQFLSTETSWSKLYLHHSDKRITTILKSTLGNAFWENYSRVLVDYVRNKRLLFRIKYVAHGSVWLCQLWDGEASSENFAQEALQGVNTYDLLKEKGISSVEVKSSINFARAKEKLHTIRSNDHILQFVNEPFIERDMKIGDPLKSGRSYLPFPEEGSQDER